jgi:hypothetical protein
MQYEERFGLDMTSVTQVKQTIVCRKPHPGPRSPKRLSRWFGTSTVTLPPYYPEIKKAALHSCQSSKIYRRK